MSVHVTGSRFLQLCAVNNGLYIGYFNFCLFVCLFVCFVVDVLSVYLSPVLLTLNFKHSFKVAQTGISNRSMSTRLEIQTACFVRGADRLHKDSPA